MMKLALVRLTKPRPEVNLIFWAFSALNPKLDFRSSVFFIFPIWLLIISVINSGPIDFSSIFESVSNPRKNAVNSTWIGIPVSIEIDRKSIFSITCMLHTYIWCDVVKVLLYTISYVRRGTTIRCTVEAGGHIQRLRSSSKLWWEPLRSPLNNHSREVTSNLSTCLYRGENWGQIVHPDVLYVVRNSIKNLSFFTPKIFSPKCY